MTLAKPILLAAAISLGALAPAQADFAPREEIAALTGTCRSTAPEPWYGGFGTREFIFADGRWELSFTHALDPAMTLRTFQFRTGGAAGDRGPLDQHGLGAGAGEKPGRRGTDGTAAIITASRYWKA